jgi:hypothetical protein
MASLYASGGVLVPRMQQVGSRLLKLKMLLLRPTCARAHLCTGLEAAAQVRGASNQLICCVVACIICMESGV